MGAVPKHRISPRRKAKRRTHYKLQPVALVRCAHCEAYHRPQPHVPDLRHLSRHRDHRHRGLIPI